MSASSASRAANLRTNRACRQDSLDGTLATTCYNSSGVLPLVYPLHLMATLTLRSPGSVSAVLSPSPATTMVRPLLVAGSSVTGTSLATNQR